MNTAGSVVTIGEPGTGRPRRRRSFSASAAASCCCRDAMRSRCCCRCRAALSRFRSMRARLRASRSSMVELLRFWPIVVCWSRPVRGWCARIDILRPFPRAERGEELGVTPAWVRPVKFCSRRAFRERGRATLLPGGFSGWGVVRRHAIGCDAAATSRALGAAAEQRSRRDSGRSPRRRSQAPRTRGSRRRMCRSRYGSALYVQRVVSGALRCTISPTSRHKLWWGGRQALVPLRGGQHSSCHASIRPAYASGSRLGHRRLF